MEVLDNNASIWEAWAECGILKTVRTRNMWQTAVGCLPNCHSSTYTLLQIPAKLGIERLYAPQRMSLLRARLSHSLCQWMGRERHKYQFCLRRHEISASSFGDILLFKWTMKRNALSFLLWSLNNVVWGWATLSCISHLAMTKEQVWEKRQRVDDGREKDGQKAWTLIIL